MSTQTGAELKLPLKGASISVPGPERDIDFYYLGDEGDPSLRHVPGCSLSVGKVLVPIRSGNPLWVPWAGGVPRSRPMIRVVMFDLGGTLVDNDRRPFPHITDALTAIVAFKTADGKPLRSCLVSDYTMPEPPATQ